MSKEKLKFKISGKSIVYEGRPESRAKDLMDILAKIGVKDDAVVSTFRENIDEQADYTDGQIRDLHARAVQAREDKKRGKAAAASGGEASPPASSPLAEPEQKQKITITHRGKQVSYTGYPSEKQKAIIQLLAKEKGMTPELAVETFRANLPDSTASDDEIWGLVDERINARGGGRSATTAAAASSAGQAAAQGGNNTASAAGYEAMDEFAGMSAQERDELDNFIKWVVTQPDMNVSELIQTGPAPAREEEDPLAGTQTRMAGKIPIYCQEKGTSVKKLITVTANVSYEEVAGTVEKKYGRRMALSFYEGEDLVELDDDDVLGMFLEMNSSDKKLNLICSNPAERSRHVDDQITEGTNVSTIAVTTTKAKAYSNGELSVKELRTYAGHSLAVYCCAFSTKGDQFVTASRDRSVRLWNVRTGSCTVMKGGHNGFVLSCDFSPKGNRVVSASDDRTIKVWNTNSCSKVATLKGHEDKVYCVQYSPDGKHICSASVDHTVRVWDGDACTRVATLKGHSLAVFSCCFSNTDRGKYVASGSDDRLIKIWDWEAGKEVRSLVGHIGTVWSVEYSHKDQFLVSASMDHELKLWDAFSGACLRTMTGHKTPIHHATFSDDDRYIYSCARDWTVMGWRTSNGEHVETITGHLSTVYHVAIQGSKMLTSSLDDTLKLWEVDQLTKA